jgi:hypothetical protein
MEVASKKKSSGFGDDADVFQPGRRLEYFWLCEECSPSLTLAFDKAEGITAVPRRRSKGAVAK